MLKSIKAAVRRQISKKEIADSYKAIKPLPKREGIKFEELSAEEKKIFCRVPMTKEARKRWQEIADKLERK